MDLMEARRQSHKLRKSVLHDVVIQNGGTRFDDPADVARTEIDLDEVLAQNTALSTKREAAPFPSKDSPDMLSDLSARANDRKEAVSKSRGQLASVAGAVAGGVQDAALGLVSTVEDVAQFAEDTAEQSPMLSKLGGLLGVITPGVRGFQYARKSLAGPDDMRMDDAIDKGLQDMGLRIPEGDGAIESLARGLVQFGAGMAAAPVKGAGYLKMMLRGGFADALFDPEDGNISTLLRELGLDNAVLEYMDSAVDEDADAAERLKARLTNSFEGGIAGGIIDIAVTGLRIAKSNEGFRNLIREKLTGMGKRADDRIASSADSNPTDVVTGNKNAGYGKLSSKAQDAANKLSKQFGVNFDVSNHPTAYGNSSYVSGRISGPGRTYVRVGFRLSDHSTGDKRKATDDFLTIIDGDDISPESLISEVQSQIERAKPKMDALAEKRLQTRATQADALDRWAKLSGDERGEIASKFKEKKSGYASNVPWRNLTKQQKADFASRENLFDGGV